MQSLQPSYSLQLQTFITFLFNLNRIWNKIQVPNTDGSYSEKTVFSNINFNKLIRQLIFTWILQATSALPAVINSFCAKEQTSKESTFSILGKMQQPTRNSLCHQEQFFFSFWKLTQKIYLRGVETEKAKRTSTSQEVMCTEESDDKKQNTQRKSFIYFC